MAPGANIHYYASASCFDDDFLDTLAKVVDENTAADRHRTRGATSRRTRPPTTIAAYEQVFLQGAMQGISFMFSSGDNGDELANTGTKQADYPTSDPYVTAVGGTSTRSAPTASSRSRPAGAPTKYSLSADGKSWTPRRLPLRRRRRRIGAVQPARPTRTASSRQRRPAGARTWRWTPTRRPACWSARRRPSRTASYYDEYRIGGTSLASPLFAGMTALSLQHARRAASGLLNPAIYAKPATAFTDVKGKPTDAGNVRVDYANGVDAADGLLLLGAHLQPGQQPQGHQGMGHRDGPRRAEHRRG